MNRLIFKVLVPAMRVGPNGVAVQDSTKNYVAPTSSLPGGKLPPIIGGAHVIVGTKVGNKWMGCTYIKPPFGVPGFGEVEVV